MFKRFRHVDLEFNTEIHFKHKEPYLEVAEINKKIVDYVKEILEYNVFEIDHIRPSTNSIVTDGKIGIYNGYLQKIRSYNAELWIYFTGSWHFFKKVEIIMKVNSVRFSDIGEVSNRYYGIVIGGQRSLKDLIYDNFSLRPHYDHYIKIITGKTPKLVKCSKGIPVHIVKKDEYSRYVVTLEKGVMTIRTNTLVEIDSAIKDFLQYI